jgi:5-carboxymethyl-2-hydroxymuconate isomerase
MPHIIIEYSANLSLGYEWEDMLKECHQILTDTLPTSIESCRSRIIPCEIFHVGDHRDDDDKAFVAVTIKALVTPERTEEILTNTAKEIFKVIHDRIRNENLDNNRIDFSVEIVPLSPVYIKDIT